MAQSIAEISVTKRVDTLLAQSDNWKPVLKQYIAKIGAGFWPMDYVNCVFQATSGCDVYSAYCFAHLHAWVSIGKILMASIDLGLTPLEDNAIAEINQMLAALPEPFSAEFWGGVDDRDGYVKWSEPIEFGQMDCLGREVNATVEPMTIPLEVGYTKGSTSLCHVLHEGGLARWPYGSKFIHLFVRNPNWPRHDHAA